MKLAAGSSTASLIALLVAVSALNPLAVNIFVPAIPSIVGDLDSDFATIQLALSAYLYATAVSQLVLGPLSDRFGRRPVLIAGLLVFILASIGCLIAPDAPTLVASRVIQGFGGCAGIVLGRAIIRDRYDGARAASMLGYVTMGFATAPMIAPLIGGMLDDHLGWRSIFALLVGLGVLTLAATLVGLPETRPATAASAPRPSLIGSVAILMRIPAFWAFALSSASATSVFFAFLGGTPFVASQLLGLSGTAFGAYFICVSVGFILGNFLTARFASRFGLFAIMLAGSVLAIAAVAAMGLAFFVGWLHPLALFGPMYAVGFANGLTIANAIAGAVSVRPELAGAASGLAGSLQVGAGATATVIVGALLDATHSTLVLAAVMLLIAVVGLLMVLWTRTARG